MQDTPSLWAQLGDKQQTGVVRRTEHVSLVGCLSESSLLGQPEVPGRPPSQRAMWPQGVSAMSLAFPPYTIHLLDFRALGEMCKCFPLHSVKQLFIVEVFTDLCKTHKVFITSIICKARLPGVKSKYCLLLIDPGKILTFLCASVFSPIRGDKM